MSKSARACLSLAERLRALLADEWCEPHWRWFYEDQQAAVDALQETQLLHHDGVAEIVRAVARRRTLPLPEDGRARFRYICAAIRRCLEAAAIQEAHEMYLELPLTGAAAVDAAHQAADQYLSDLRSLWPLGRENPMSPDWM